MATVGVQIIMVNDDRLSNSVKDLNEKRQGKVYPVGVLNCLLDDIFTSIKRYRRRSQFTHLIIRFEYDGKDTKYYLMTLHPLADIYHMRELYNLSKDHVKESMNENEVTLKNLVDTVDDLYGWSF